jgi:hypothetical protein
MGVADIIPPRVPNGLAEIMATYGDPRYRPPGQVDPAWESANMVKVYDLPLVGHALYVHRAILTPLRRALARCQVIGGYNIHTIGCFAPRAQRGSNGLLLSTHTWGIAVDINPDTNKLIAPCYEDDPRRTDPANCDIPRAWIDAFKAEGWFWGADFGHRFDPMHLQFATGY